jgi:hypothetical protein
LQTLHRDTGLARRLARNGFEWVTRNGSLASMIAGHAALYRGLTRREPTLAGTP